jgi:protein O-mannosyl-transferase
MADRRAQPVIDAAAFLLLAAAVWLTFSRAVAVPFFYDDFPAIVDNATIRSLWPIAVPLHAPRETPFAGRPLVNLSAAVNYQIGQLNPTGYRLFNRACHTVSAMLLFVIVRRALVLWRPSTANNSFSTSALAFAVALVWAVHPLQTESVCYVTQRTELMMGAFYLATIYSGMRFWAAQAPNTRRLWCGMAVAACLAGMACKEVMVSAPLVVLLFDRTFVSGSFINAWQKSRPLYISLAFTWLMLAILAVDAPRSAVAGFRVGVSPIDWWLTQCQVLLMYLRLAFWPWPLSIHYEMPYLSTIGAGWPYVALVAALVAATLFALRRNWPSGFLAASFFLILAPTLIIPIVTEVAAERRMYLPLAAVVTLVVVGAYRLIDLIAPARLPDRTPLLPAIVILMVSLPAAIALGAVSNHRLAAYRDPVTLWRDTLSQYPRSELAQANLGFALMRVGEDREAIEHLAEAVALNPSAEDAHFQLGVLYKKEGQLDEAARHYGEAARLNPTNAVRHNDYGSALMRLRQFPEAIEQFQQALKLDPEMRTARYNLALTYAGLGRTRDSIAEYELLLQRAPDDMEVHVALAKALLLANQTELAVGHLERALELAKQAKQNGMVSDIEALLSRLDANSPPTSPSKNETNQ